MRPVTGAGKGVLTMNLWVRWLPAAARQARRSARDAWTNINSPTSPSGSLTGPRTPETGSPMRRLAFSTLACPDWTLDRAISYARACGYDGIELRTFGYGSTRFACDPAMAAPEKTLAQLRDSGIDVVSLATSISLHAPIRPRVLGRVFGDQERDVREAKAMIDLAAQLEAPYVRVYGFESPHGESMKSTFKLVVARLRMITDHAHRTGVKVAFESGGSFSSPDVLGDLLGAVDNRLLGICWNAAVACADGHMLSPEIAQRTLILRLGDRRLDGQPCQLGEGDLPLETHASVFRDHAPRDACAVFEWARAWMPSLAEPDDVVAAAAPKMADWLADHARAAI